MGSNTDYFVDAARSAITGTMIFEVKDAAQHEMLPSLPNVRALLTQDTKALKVSVEKMIAGNDFDVVTRLRKFLASTDEVESTKAMIEANTAWMTAPMRVDMVPAKGKGVDFRACTETPTTIYVILPTQELQAKAVYLRLVLSAALRGLYHA